MYKSVGKVTSGESDYCQLSSTASIGFTIKSYNEVTGILILDAGNAQSTTTLSNFRYSDTSEQNNGYVTFAASKSPALVGIQQPQVAYLKDVKASGTAGGTFTAGAWQTRTLNTVEGDASIVSLSANQFTLAAGKYEIEASAPAGMVGGHILKLRNITDSTDVLAGTVEYTSQNAYYAVTQSKVEGVLNLTSSKTLEIQHRCDVTRASDGFGAASIVTGKQIGRAHV